MNEVISQATKRNWDKLNTLPEERLTKRANKRLSQKRMIPVEYFLDKNNVSFVQKIIEEYNQENWKIEDFMYSIGLAFLKWKGIDKKPNVKKVMKDYKKYSFIPKFGHLVFPENEVDILGAIYQSVLSEGNKNSKGSYYTSAKVAKNMMQGLDFGHGETLLDPCCGSGIFLLLADATPSQLFGIDKDPIAVMLTKINLLVKYENEDFFPQVICADYLEEKNVFPDGTLVEDSVYQYIITNPPWGAVSNKKIAQISSNETFSYFFVKSFLKLSENGIIRFLLPESILNVRTHRDIRTFILDHCCIESITLYEDTFTGVVTKYIDIKCTKGEKKNQIDVYSKEGKKKIPISNFYETKNNIFNFLEAEDIAILKKVKEKGKYNLEDSIWALGIVTGDNNKKLKKEYQEGLEEIYTGKEVQPYLLKKSNYYIQYDRKNLQQVAKEEYYRAPEKLVYKFISNQLVFAYDNQQKLFLNSANILIPSIPNMSIKTVMAFLNSELYQFLYCKMFGELKVLKGNLMELPFLEISSKENQKLEHLVDQLLLGKTEKKAEIEMEIFKIYDLEESQVEYVRRSLYGKIN